MTLYSKSAQWFAIWNSPASAHNTNWILMCLITAWCSYHLNNDLCVESQGGGAKIIEKVDSLGSHWCMSLKLGFPLYVNLSHWVFVSFWDWPHWMGVKGANPIGFIVINCHVTTVFFNWVILHWPLSSLLCPWDCPLLVSSIQWTALHCFFDVFIRVLRNICYDWVHPRFMPFSIRWILVLLLHCTWCYVKARGESLILCNTMQQSWVAPCSHSRQRLGLWICFTLETC